MGFTTVNTKDGKSGRISKKDEYDSMSEYELASIDPIGEPSMQGESKDSKDAKRLGSSREKARAANFKRNDKSMDEVDDDELDSITNKMIFGPKKK